MDRKVDILFLVRGGFIPVDHGYALFSAVSALLPGFHEAQNIGLALIRGRYAGDGLLDISPRSWLRMRLSASLLSEYLALAGKRLELLGHTVTLGVPHAKALTPASTLTAALVTTRNGKDQTRFEEECQRQLESLGVKGRLTVGQRKTFRVREKQIVGYAVTVSELTAEESITLQEQGLGGRRKMGGGFFEGVQR